MQAQAQGETLTDSAIEALLRMPTVRRLTGLGRSTIYKMIAEDKFPKPVRIGERAVAWRESELNHWSQARPRSS
ncbi:AlpA family phage regulatory protein [Paucibacter sp. R3-3]|uniref:AlpA family phage regulatory protein n=1 Tax=Roseateles agri TaxID=3098619 RepID=A0ABU5DAT3_9BURK|nr:AlpA family phage regulatory protein [Paucibacter sp. R3-3]MDY0743391.1 AlpA family phage regulatory protein [Paucibacter sp. R3-3]